MRIDLKKLLGSIAKIAVPVAVGAVLTHRSVKGALVEAAKEAAAAEVGKLSQTLPALIADSQRRRA